MNVPDHSRVAIDPAEPVWDRFFMVSALFLVGSREEDGSWDFAPKHMGCPLSWENYFGFVCTPRHSTYHNVLRERQFTVTFPRPSQVLFTSLAATCRESDGSKPALRALPTISATRIDGRFLEDGYLFLECELERIVDGFGPNSLIAGRVVAAQADERAVRRDDLDDHEVVRASEILAYLAPGRFATIEENCSFPFTADFRR